MGAGRQPPSTKFTPLGGLQLDGCVGHLLELLSAEDQSAVGHHLGGGGGRRRLGSLGGLGSRVGGRGGGRHLRAQRRDI